MLVFMIFSVGMGSVRRVGDALGAGKRLSAAWAEHASIISAASMQVSMPASSPYGFGRRSGVAQ
jgi:hypothetical protein